MPDPSELEERWPYLTAGVEPVPVLIRRSWDDFRVREIPLHEPTGDGNHVLLEVEKRGISTAAAVRDLARVLGVRAQDVGVAGLKDTRAVTIQRMSVEHVDTAAARAVVLPRLRVRDAWRTRRKLRTGQHAGNAFVLTLRAPADDAERDEDAADTRAGEPDIRDRLDDVRGVLAVLSERGIPNYFGAQRFGMRADNHLVGRALLRGDFAEACALIAGRPGPGDTGDLLRARTLYEQGRYLEAAGAWPRGNAEAARVARARAQGRDDRGAVLAAGKRLLRFHVSALQSALFNDALALRVDALDGIERGDIAWLHRTERVFEVEDPTAASESARRCEISASGPLFGPRMLEPSGTPARRERSVLDGAGLTAHDFSATGPWGAPGGRRPLRVPGISFRAEGGRDDAGPFLRLEFALPPGAYATAVLREIAKGRLEVGTARAWEAAR